MRRWPFFAALSVTAVLAAMLALSYARDFGYAGKRYFAIAGGGVAYVGTQPSEFRLFVWVADLHRGLVDPFPGFGYESNAVGTGVAVPIWFLALVSLAIAFLVRPRRPLPPNHCRKCMYDLTGNTSGTCPECGSPTQPE